MRVTLPGGGTRGIAPVAALAETELDLTRVTAPALVMRGDYLPTANEELIARLVAQLSNTDPAVHAIHGSGHATNLDNPDFFTTRLRELLTDYGYS